MKTIIFTFIYPTTGTSGQSTALSNDRRKARRIVRLSRRELARLQRSNPRMPAFFTIRFKAVAR